MINFLARPPCMQLPYWFSSGDSKCIVVGCWKIRMGIIIFGLSLPSEWNDHRHPPTRRVGGRTRTRTCKKRTRTNEPRPTDGRPRTRRAMLFRHCVRVRLRSVVRPSVRNKAWEENGESLGRASGRCGQIFQMFCLWLPARQCHRARDCDRLIAIVEPNIDRGVPTF